MLKKNLEQIIAEKDLLFTCRTNKGFIQRLSTRFLPKLRTDSNILPFITEWEQSEIQEELLKQQAYKELAHAFIEVKKVLAILEAKGTKICLDKECKITAVEHIQDAICAENSFLSCREPPYARVYYKIKALYINHISKSYEIEFAPTALDLIEKDKLTNFLASGDCDASFLWRHLTSIERAWKVAGNRHSIGWEKILIDDETMWLNSDAAFRIAFRNFVANELWNSDEPSYKREFYERRLIESLIDRLLKEITLLLASNSGQKTDEQSNHRSATKRNEDIKALIPFAQKMWEKEFPKSTDPMHMSPEELANELLANLPHTLRLHTEGDSRLPRAVAAIKKTDPRIFKGGKYLGPKTHWQNFAWVTV